MAHRYIHGLLSLAFVIGIGCREAKRDSPTAAQSGSAASKSVAPAATPKHGGVVRHVGDVDTETIIAPSGHVAVFVRDAHGDVDVKRLTASGEALIDGKTTRFELEPDAKENALHGDGPRPGEGTTVRIDLSMDGHRVGKWSLAVGIEGTDTTEPIADGD